MEILIVGPGAMGCLFAARLFNAGYKVTLLDHNEKRADEINRHGIDIQGVSGSYNARVPVITKLSGINADIVLICVKSGNTIDAAKSIKTAVKRNTLIATLQNGIGNVEILKEFFGNDKIIGGITSEGATSLAHGKIRHAGSGSTVLGPREKPGASIDKLVEAFNRAGFSASSADNVNDLIWGKLIINVGINALTAITGLKNGQLPGFKGTFEIMKDAVNEAIAVSKAKNISLPYDDPLKKVLEVCSNTSGNIASMLQDVLNKRNTEIAFINGAICREGEIAGIPTPVNLTLTRLVETIESSYDMRLI